MGRASLVFAIVAWAASTSCASPDPIRVHLIQDPSLRLREDLETLTVRVVDASTDEVLQQTEVPGEQLGDRTDLFDAGGLREGEAYRLELRGAAPSACRRGRVVGRSVPFTHRGGSYPVAVQLGCADEIAELPGRPAAGRLAHVVITNAHGRAVIAGGARRAELGAMGLRVSDAAPVVETYDPTSGRFLPAGALARTHVLPAGVALEDGPVAVIGGWTGEGFDCTSSVELVTEDGPRAAAGLATGRCAPAAVPLPEAGATAVLGSSDKPLQRRFDAEVYEPDLSDRTLDNVTGAIYRNVPVAVPLADGRSALVLGGAQPSQRPLVEHFHVGSECSEARACFAEVAMDGAPTDGWQDTAASYVPCRGGSGGAVYAVGGVTGPSDAREALDGVWCYRDEPGERARMVPAGRLPAPRHQHALVTVGGPGGSHRLLVIGGTRDDADNSTLPYGNALVARVDGCSCDEVRPSDFEELEVPFRGFPLLTAADVLPDGSVLLVGGLELDGGTGGDTLQLRGTNDAALFIPELE